MKPTKNPTILLLILILLPAVYATSYSYAVQESGETDVVISSAEKISIQLPPDVLDPSVEEGSYQATEKGIEVIPDGTAMVRYTSSYHTRKQEGIWYFEGSVHKGANVTLSLPDNIQIVQARPRSRIREEGLSWANVSTENITVSYVRIQSGAVSQPQKSYPQWVPISLLGLVILFALLYKKKGSSEPDMSEGQLNVIRAANANEAVVLKILLKHKGHIKRNIPEKESKLSKSSLASSLKNLEKKDIIQIDRSFHVHYIVLSDWFKEL